MKNKLSAHMTFAGTLFEYACDLLYAGTQYQTGLSRRDVVQGYFASTPKGNLQQIFFRELLACGFERTHWQIVFPGQTAGLIRKIEPPIQGMDEIHIRFYEEGRICAELEYGRFSINHWRGLRVSSIDILEELLEQEMKDLPSHTKSGIREQFCLEEHDVKASLAYQEHMLQRLTYGFFVLQIPLTALGIGYYSHVHDIYAALEPSFLLGVESIAYLAARQKTQGQ